MFATLLKHEARLQGPTMLVFTGIALVIYAAGILAALTRIPAIAGFGLITSLTASGLIMVAFPAYLLIRYYQSLYGREGYLTMALPVRSGTLYAAKFTWASLTWLASTVVVLILWLGLVLLQTSAQGATVADLTAAVREGLAQMPPAFPAMVVLGIVVSMVLYLAQFAWVVTFGMEERFRSLGIGGPVVVWVVSYAVMQVLATLAIILIPLGATPDLSGLVFTSFLPEMTRSLNNEEPAFVPLGWVVVLVLTAPVFVVWTLRSMKHHTSLR